MQSTQLAAFRELQFNLQDNILKLNLPPLGPSFVSLAFNDCQDALIAHRLSKKISKVEASQSRALNSVKDMLAYDENGLTHFQPGGDSSCDPFIKWQIYHLRHKFHKILKDFRIDYHDFNFPSGESIVSNRGNVSLYAKLRDLKQWCVTRDCRDHFIKLVFSNLWFKRAALYHVRKNPFYMKHKRKIDKHLWAQHKDDSNPAYSIFRVKMIQFILTIVPGARLATVPKDNTKDRVIEIESLGNMCVQRAIAKSVIKIIKKEFGYDLTLAQELHGLLIEDHENSTIDFSNASNSNWTSLLDFYFPPRVISLLKETRSQVVSYQGEYYPLNMIAPMGNGFTFEIMSLFLLTVAREFDSLASVFGDDVIIHKDVAPSFITFMQYHGWIINETKSFVDGNFRESCGYFHHIDGYMTSYDFWLAEDAVDIMVCTNKIFVLLDHVTNASLHGILKDFWNKAINLNCVRSFRDSSKSRQFIPERLVWHKPFGEYSGIWHGWDLKPLIIPASSDYPLDKGVLIKPARYRKLTKILPLKELLRYKRLKQRFSSKANELNYKFFDICVYPQKDFSDHAHRAPLSGIRNRFWLATYFRFGRVVQPKSNTSIIKLKKLLITGIDIEL